MYQSWLGAGQCIMDKWAVGVMWRWGGSWWSYTFGCASWTTNDARVVSGNLYGPERQLMPEEPAKRSLNMADTSNCGAITLYWETRTAVVYTVLRNVHRKWNAKENRNTISRTSLYENKFFCKHHCDQPGRTDNGLRGLQHCSVVSRTSCWDVSVYYISLSMFTNS